ncbi:MAG: D-glycero-beta-D-manno-heptose 1-phosphate adenylyltransferase [SAR324 cluster bacterium]|uniref:D-glycero-beta-D-manno-heptose 1-phosphate adenylyltransferase n=1 Tax=SAR324 cluster bacterium TaxID=2024889 RepID=A0A2A4T1T2_9DELT|nr:MAG: D-glycero-beta-D-manno-heptose 1-phosphate adenylyltransferase [SAR324 cluster bacterium]
MPEKKIYLPPALRTVLEELQAKGKKIVFTNGCFDLLHTGHSRYLKAARAAGDYLVIAVNSDQSVATLKGPKRPIRPLAERMEMLSEFHFVDFVVSFDELDPHNIIGILQPDLLIKGGDWSIDKIIGKDIVEARGGKVFTIPEIPGESTTDIIELILARYSE